MQKEAYVCVFKKCQWDRNRGCTFRLQDFLPGSLRARKVGGLVGGRSGGGRVSALVHVVVHVAVSESVFLSERLSEVGLFSVFEHSYLNERTVFTSPHF